MAKVADIDIMKPPRGHEPRRPDALINQSKPIVDALQPYEITLTAKDIRSAVANDPKKCGFAQACTRQTKHQALIYRSTAYLEFDEAIVRFRVNPSMSRELVSLDRGGAMDAGTYWLAPVQKGRRYGDDTRTKPNGKAKLGSARTPIHVTRHIRPNVH